MKRYIQFILNGKRYRFLIDEELDKVLKRILRERYKFDNNNILSLETTDLTTSYKDKQLIFKAILDQIDTFDLTPELKRRIDILRGYINTNKTSVYYSDLSELDSLLSEASEIYNNVRTNLAKKEEAQEKREQTKKSIDEIAQIIEDTNYESENISNTTSTTDDKIEEFNAILDDIMLDETLKDEVPIEKIKKAIDRIVICDSMEEFVSKTGSSYDLESSIKNENAKIVLPPNSKLEDVVIKIISTTTSTTTLNKVVTYMERKASYQNQTSTAFERLRSNLGFQGLNSRNLNYLADQFISEYQRICNDTGISFESMFADYFNSYSANRRYNSPLDKFIRSFIKFNGGKDQSLRELLEATIVKKATAAHLISNRYNNYLSPTYRDLYVNGNGTINFGTTLDNRINMNSELNLSGNTNLTASTDIQTSKDLDSTTTIRGKNALEQANKSTGSIEGTFEKRAELNSQMNDSSTLNMQEELNQGSKIDQAIPTPSIKAGLLEETPGDIIANVPKTSPNASTNINNSQVAPNIIPIVDGTAARQIEPILDLAENSSQDTPANPKVIPFSRVSNRRNTNNKFNTRPQANQNSGNNIINIGNHLAARQAGLINPFMNEADEDQDIINDEEPNINDAESSLNEENNEFNNDNESTPSNEPNVSEDDNNQDASNLRANNIENAIEEDIKDQVKQQAGKAAIEFIKKNPYILVVGGIILLILLLILLTMADMEQQKRNAYKTSSSGCAGEGGNIVSFLAGWEGTSGSACTKNGLSGNTAVDQNDGTLTTGTGVTNHLVSSLSDYIRANNLTGYFHLNSSNNTYYMSEGDCIPSEVSEELKEVGVREIYAAPIEKIATELGIELTEYQKDAITSFNYNLGAGHTRELLEAYKNDGYEGLWNKMKLYVKSQGEVLTGLKKRRKGEFALFVTGDYSDQGAFYSRGLNNYDDYDSEGVMSREYVCSYPEGDGSLIAINGFQARLTRPLRTNSFFYDPNTGDAYSIYEGECAWYATYRAKEILASINSTKTWESSRNGGYFCQSPEVLNNTFPTSNNVHAPQPGSLISWKQGTNAGHVAVVEQVFNDGSIMISEAYVKLGVYGQLASQTIHRFSDIKAARRQNCEGNGSGCFTTRKISADQIQNAGWSKGYQFDCYIYLR